MDRTDVAHDMEDFLVPQPPISPFRVSTEHAGDTWRVAAQGELDIEGVPGLQSAVEAARQRSVEHVVLDLSLVTFIDSSGIRVLLESTQRAEGRPDLRIVSSPAVDRVIDLTGLRDHLPLIDPA